VGAVSLLATFIFISINPAQQFTNSRNNQRLNDLRGLADAVYQYSVDNTGTPLGIDAEWRVIGTGANCNINCGTAGPTPMSFTDNSQVAFNGAYSNTQFITANSTVQLTSAGRTALTGTYTSTIKDGLSSSTWQTMSWISIKPYGKELPNNKAIETGYTSGNANITKYVIGHVGKFNSSIHFTNVSANRYFQYRVILETDNNAITPALGSITISSLTNATITPSQCVDLTASLVPKYLAYIPIDPSSGSSATTNYAIKKTGQNRISVMSCVNDGGSNVTYTK